MRVVAKKINNNECGYITEGKAYEVENCKKQSFLIVDDEGDLIQPRFKDCDHIKADWTIIGNPAVAMPLDEFNKMEK